MLISADAFADQEVIRERVIVFFVSFIAFYRYTYHPILLAKASSDSHFQSERIVPKNAKTSRGMN